MKNWIIALVGCFCALFSFSQNLSRHVYPLIGTMGFPVYGRTTPFVTPPFGMTHWTPMTNYPVIRLCNYLYERQVIVGFRGTHKPAMWMGDYGHVTLMPGTGRYKISAMRRGMRFSHKLERSHPTYYSVQLRPHRAHPVNVAMTASARCGFFEIELPPQGGWVLLEASKMKEFKGFIEVDAAKNEVRGYNPDHRPVEIHPDLTGFKGYFVARFDQPFAAHEVYKDKQKVPGQDTLSAGRVGAFVQFNSAKVKVKIGTSFISWEQAEENLEREIPGWYQVDVLANIDAEWEKYLGRVQVKGATEDELVNLYTAMYHCFLFPRTFSEYGRYFSAFDMQVHEGVSYNDFSLWDTFRAQHPLLTLLAPEKVDGMCQALIQMYQEGGYMPKWPNPSYSNIMIGTHADAVLADAYTKGFRGFDADSAWAAMYKNAMVPQTGDTIYPWGDRDDFTGYEARGGLTYYKRLGYVAADKTAESVSRTVEFSYGDYCLAVMAKAMGKEKEAQFFLDRSRNYRNLYQSESGFLAPRNADGSWHSKATEGFTEGSPWTYLFGAMHDVPGMIEMMGGEAKFLQKLDENFEEDHYVHENEPGHHYCYLYNWTSHPWKTQERVAKYRTEKYRNHPNGLDGDDDCGQMSAWYLFSAMGFYPVAPGSGEYAIGTPLFSEMVVQLAEGKALKIIGKGVSKENIYVQSVKWNGVALERPFIRHADLVQGGVLEFEMGPEPARGLWK